MTSKYPPSLAKRAVSFYLRGIAGELGAEVPLVESTSTDDTAFERIYGEVPSDLLVQVMDTDGHDGDETFDFTADTAAFEDLGILDPSTDVTRPDEMLAADGQRQYLAFAEPGSQLQVEVTGDGGIDVTTSRASRCACSTRPTR